MPGPAACVIGLWGTFDLENYGDHLFSLVTAHELRRRLGDVELRMFSPYGWRHPTRLDAGQLSEPFGPWSAARREQLAGELDAVLVGGGEIIHTRDDLLAAAYGTDPDEMAALAPSRWMIEGLGESLERDCPVLWQAVGIPFDPSEEEALRLRSALAKREYVSVRDEFSLNRLRSAGVEADVTLVPDLAFLLPRVLTAGPLDRRLRYLKVMGWYPADGHALVVQGNRDLAGFVPELAPVIRRFIEQRPDWRVVLAEVGVCHGDGQFADTMQRALDGQLAQAPLRMPAEAGVEDIAAAVSAAGAFVGISLHGCITACVHDRPFVVLNLNRQSKLSGFGRLVDRVPQVIDQPGALPGALAAAFGAGSSSATVVRLQAKVDEHFDRVATIVEAAAGRRLVDADGPGRVLSPRLEWLQGQLEATARAHTIKGQRLAVERMLFADRVQELVEDRNGLHRRAAELEAALSERTEAAAAAATRADDEAAARRGVEEELARVMATKTFRYLAPLRRAYGRAYGRLRS